MRRKGKPPDMPRSLGKYLQFQCQEQRISQRELAAATGIARETLTKIFRDTFDIRDSQIRRLAHAIHVPQITLYAYLLLREPEHSQAQITELLAALETTTRQLRAVCTPNTRRRKLTAC
jgi:transcriptional regulator with XRE-family HTH domain